MGVLQGVVGEADDDEQDGQHTEAEDLDGLATDGVDGGNSGPVSGDSTSTDQDQVSDSVAVEDLVDVVASSPADSAQDNRVVETESVESWILVSIVCSKCCRVE